METLEIVGTKLAHTRYLGSVPLDGGKDLLMVEFLFLRSITRGTEGGSND
jgi:hypothetical protein